MWRRFRRRTFAPRRPLVHEAQLALVVVTAVLLVGSIAYVAWVVFLA